MFSKIVLNWRQQQIIKHALDIYSARLEQNEKNPIPADVEFLKATFTIPDSIELHCLIPDAQKKEWVI